MKFLPEINRKGKCRRCDADIEGPPNKKYCEACRKIVSAKRVRVR